MTEVDFADCPDLEWRQKMVLEAVAQHGPVTILRLSELLDEPDHAVRGALHRLAELGLVESAPDPRKASAGRLLWEAALG